MKSWQESQEKLAKKYAEVGGEWMENMLGQKEKTPDVFDGWVNSQDDLTKQFFEFSKNLQDSITRIMGGKLPPELLKFMNFSFFEEFYKNWLSGLELPGEVKKPLNMAGGWDDATKFLQSLLEQDNPFFSMFNNAKFSDEMGRVFGMLQGAGAPGWSVFGDLLGGYEDFLTKLVDSTTAQGIDTLAEGFENWSKEMEKHLMSPKVGINRELLHDVSQALVFSKDYFHAYGQMARLVEVTSRKAGTRFQLKLSEMALQKKPVLKFVDFCALWAVEYEAVFGEVLGSQDYARLQGEFVDAGHRLKIQWNKLAEEVLESTPIALKRDLDLAIAELHQMKREIKGLKRALKEERKAADEAQVAAVAAATEAAKDVAVEAAREAVAAAKPARTTRAKKAQATPRSTKGTSRKNTTKSDKE